MNCFFENENVKLVQTQATLDFFTRVGGPLDLVLRSSHAHTRNAFASNDISYLRGSRVPQSPLLEVRLVRAATANGIEWDWGIQSTCLSSYPLCHTDPSPPQDALLPPLEHFLRLVFSQFHPSESRYVSTASEGNHIINM